METLTLDSQVYQVLLDKLGIEPENISASSRFNEDLGIDSLDFFEIIITLEDTFNITIPSEDSEKIRTAGDLIVYLHKRINHI